MCQGNLHPATNGKMAAIGAVGGKGIAVDCSDRQAAAFYVTIQPEAGIVVCNEVLACQ